jgi:hypothetical protein
LQLHPVLDDKLQSIWDAGVEFKPNQTLRGDGEMPTGGNELDNLF